MGDQISIGGLLGANFCAGFAAGSLAAAVTCPLDVARTRRQIEVVNLFSLILDWHFDRLKISTTKIGSCCHMTILN